VGIVKQYILLAHPETRVVVRRTTSDKARRPSERHLVSIALPKRIWKKYRANDIVHLGDWPRPKR
jgi:hypothetical protein